MNTNEMFSRFREEIKSRRDVAWQEVISYNAQEQDLLHYLENEKCDAVDMVRVAKELKTIRQHRRMAKIEVDRCNSIHSSIAKKNLKKFEEKTYTYKTDALINIAGRKQGQVIQSFDENKLM
jgi:hypothetical protein